MTDIDEKKRLARARVLADLGAAADLTDADRAEIDAELGLIPEAGLFGHDTDRKRMLRALRHLVNALTISIGSMPTPPHTREEVIARVLELTDITGLTKAEREVLR